MKEEKLLEILQQNKINYLKLGSVSYEKSNNLLCLTFLYKEEDYELLNSNKSNIENVIKNYVNIHEIDYKIKYIKAFLDENRLKVLIEKYLQKYHKMSFLSLKDIKIKYENNKFEINLFSSLGEELLNKLVNELNEFLNSRYFYNFKFNLTTLNETNNLLKEHKNEILDNLVNPVIINKMQVNKVENIVGEISELSCYPYEFYSSPEENVVLCGNLQSIDEIEFTKKDGINKGIRFALKIKCLDKVFNASLFPTKKNLDIIKTIESGIDVIMEGSLDSFNNGLSLKIKNIAKCVVLDYERPKPVINKELTNYKFVFPIKYEETSQINLFDANIQKDYLLNNEFVVFDLETTGLDYMTEKITEIGAVKIKNGVITEIFSSFVNPQKPIDFDITRLTGITNEMVKDAPLIENVLPDFFKFCQDSILVAQNIQFDFGFIDYYGRKINYEFNHKKEDTMVIAKKNMFLKNYKLKTIAESLNVPLINAHRAFNDALCTAKVFIKLIEKYY